MTRIPLTGDDSGKWFDKDTAVEFEEQTRWNGNNHISVATGSQWNHETLYYTKSGRWVLHHTSQWQGSTPSWREVGLGEAVAWLIANECVTDDAFEKLPEAVRLEVDAAVQDAEV